MCCALPLKNDCHSCWWGFYTRATRSLPYALQSDQQFTRNTVIQKYRNLSNEQWDFFCHPMLQHHLPISEIQDCMSVSYPLTSINFKNFKIQDFLPWFIFWVHVMNDARFLTCFTSQTDYFYFYEIWLCLERKWKEDSISVM